MFPAKYNAPASFYMRSEMQFVSYYHLECIMGFLDMERCHGSKSQRPDQLCRCPRFRMMSSGLLQILWLNMDRLTFPWKDGCIDIESLARRRVQICKRQV